METIKTHHENISQHDIQQATQETILVDTEHVSISPIDTIFHSNLLNFILVIVFLVWLIRKTNLFSFITKRQTQIIDSIKNIEEEKKIRLNYLETTELNVANSKQEVMKIIDEGDQVASSLSERIVEEAEIESSDMSKKATNSIKTERAMASNQIVSKISNAAFYIAEEHIKQAVNTNLHQKYIDEFITNLDEMDIK